MANNINRNHAYQHSLFFDSNSEEWELTVERRESLLLEMIKISASDVSVTEEHGEDIELCFYTPSYLSGFDQGRIVQATQPNSYAFNTPESYQRLMTVC